MHTYQALKVFLSSASDVKEERHIAKAVISEVSRTVEEPLGLLLQSLLWDHLPAITPEVPEETIQDIINREVDRCDIFVLILWRRYGSIEHGRTRSNLEIEINRALQRRSEPNRRITMLTYFRELPPNEDPGTQEVKVQALEQTLRNDHGVFYFRYSDTHQFRDKLTHDLYSIILQDRYLTPSQRALRNFWELGIAESEYVPRLTIVYPPVDASFMRDDRGVPFWQKRLVPHLVFEDYKAMQKIEKGLRLIGFTNFSFCNKHETPSNIDKMNRVWLCLPRNDRGRSVLDRRYGDRSLFRFSESVGRQEGKLRWRSSLATKFFSIRSPLSKYLLEQRTSEYFEEYHKNLGDIYAKDFAVVARFSDHNSEDIITSRSPLLKDFFIAGIRGLGTWGAGWFLDRRALQLDIGAPGNADLQFLIEVEFLNGRIKEVRNVSDRDESYFQEENSLTTIRSNIKRERGERR